MKIQLASPHIDIEPSTTASVAPASQPLQKNHLYLLGTQGHLLAYSTYPDHPLAPLNSVLRLSLDGEPLKITVDGTRFEGPAHLCLPANSYLEPGNPTTVSFTFYPSNPLHRSMLRALRHPYLALDRESFRRFDDRLLWMNRGDLTHQEACALFDEMCAFVMQLLPPAPPLDARIETVLKLLDGNPSLTIGELAGAVALSSDRLTHLFTERMGIDLRRYRMSLKFSRAAALYRPEMSMTEVAQGAGFSDSPHFSRTMKDLYGASPTYFLKITQIHVPKAQ
jgi:AraC-like DNA-binding protein